MYISLEQIQVTGRQSSPSGHEKIILDNVPRIIPVSDCPIILPYQISQYPPKAKKINKKNNFLKDVLYANIIYVPLSILSATKIITKVVEPKIKVIEGSLQPIIKTEGKNINVIYGSFYCGKNPYNRLISMNVSTFFLKLTC